MSRERLKERIEDKVHNVKEKIEDRRESREWNIFPEARGEVVDVPQGLLDGNYNAEQIQEVFDRLPVKAEDLVVVATDAVSRVVGQLVSKNNNTVVLANPANVILNPTESGQLSVQLFPFFFSELLSTDKRREGTVWSFNDVTAIHTHKLALDGRLVIQYNRVFGFIREVPSNIVLPGGVNKGAPVIKLFDEE